MFLFTRPAGRVLRLALLPVAVLFVMTACQKDNLVDSVTTETSGLATDRQSNTIVDIALSNPDFSTLVAAVVKTNQVAFLSGTGLDATVFAPTNAAFANLPAPFNNAQNISAISDPRQINQLRQILRYHVALGARTASQLSNGSYPTYKNAVTPNDNVLYVGRDAAGAVFINGNTKVVAADVQASNGVIHVIDKVLLFPTQDIAQIAISNGNFTALVAAVQKTGLTNALMAPTNNFTVFAPTDAAFANLPAPLNNAANIKSITDPATINLLRNVLQYHLIGARVFSADLREGISAPTLLAGNNVSITLAGGPKVKGSGNTNGSNIVATDILARNGVIHVIDQVLLP
ncbi:MAG: fasciclin domain-containing protein [Saprospiraceae bacterium]